MTYSRILYLPQVRVTQKSVAHRDYGRKWFNACEATPRKTEVQKALDMESCWEHEARILKYELKEVVKL